MATIPWVKYDHGPLSAQGNLTDLPANCFPVRNLLRSSSSNQQWVVALRDTEQRRFAAILTTLSSPTPFETDIAQQELKRKQRWSGKEKLVDHLLDGFFIMHHCAIEDPSNVVMLNVNGLDLHEVKEEDFLLFDNVLQIDASENQLPFHGFKTFPQLIRLDLSVNQIKNIKLNINDYETLEELNLSYNSLTMHDIETLGMLSNLRVLRASGNDLVGLPRRLTKPYVHTDIHGKEYVKERYPRLEELYLDHNKLVEDELFIHLSCLKNLKRLHLQHNQIRTIPFLRVLQGRQIVQEYSKTAMKRKQSNPANPPVNFFQHSLGSTGDELIKSTIFEEDEENTSPHPQPASEDEDISLPAFPELQYLDISFNLIEEEDDIMAVASWPGLTELVLADNPLVQHHVGLPPLVESFLIDRLGMKVHRVNPSLKTEKQFYAKPIKKHRKVTSRLAKVPKIPVDQLISGAVKQYIDYVKNDADARTKEQLLPLLDDTSERNSSSDEDKQQTGDTTLNEDENKYNSYSTTADQSSNQQTENIFMTEFENDDIYQNMMSSERPNPPEPNGPMQPSLASDDKFKGFEAFLDIDNEKDISVPTNVIHCVRDLKQILRHPLVVRHDNVQVHRRQRTFIPKRMERTLPPVKLPNRPKVEEINKLLDLIRDRKTIVEQPLGQVLNNNKDKVNQRRAKSLVNQIQRHYEQVRSVSLRSVRTPGTLLDTAIDRLQEFDTNTSLNKQTMPSRLPTA